MLYIDPASYRLRAAAYNVTLGVILDLMNLPPGVQQIGPIYHLFTHYVTVDGLLFPSRYETYGEGGDAAGYHAVSALSLSRPFDESRMSMPAGALLDTSSRTRKLQDGK
ncbi:MAG: hypothetical protein L0212_11645 [Acidobacteria bacterium]|nr:hypothetical protein [Acidobacteriota bacterium]